LKYKIILLFILFITACGIDNYQTIYTITIMPYLNEEYEGELYYEEMAYHDYELIHCNIHVSNILMDALLPPPPPPLACNITSTTLTLLINGTFTTLDAKNINGSNYFRFADLQYVFKYTNVC